MLQLMSCMSIVSHIWMLHLMPHIWNLQLIFYSEYGSCLIVTRASLILHISMLHLKSHMSILSHIWKWTCLIITHLNASAHFTHLNTSAYITNLDHVTHLIAAGHTCGSHITHALMNKETLWCSRPNRLSNEASCHTSLGGTCLIVTRVGLISYIWIRIRRPSRRG